MDYELANQLKNAGFPQGGTGRWTLPPDSLVARYTDRVYVPTLSELIEACVAVFEKLQKIDEGPKALQSGKKWQAVALSDCAYGDTAEEAVARLWLTLNQESER